MLKMKARYAKAKTRKERTALIDEAVAMTHYSRKYVIRLLNGSRRHRKHRGRKPSYSRDAHQLLIRIWRAEGYMCPLYLKSIIEAPSGITRNSATTSPPRSPTNSCA